MNQKKKEPLNSEPMGKKINVQGPGKILTSL